MIVPRLMNPFAVTRLTLQVRLPKDECVKRLQLKTLAWFQLRGLFGTDVTPLSGQVNDRGFLVRRRTSFPRNSYQPVARGTWHEVDGGTEIRVAVHEDRTVAWLSLIWLFVAMVVATMFTASAAAGFFSSDLSGVSVPAMLLLPTFGLSAQMYARWLARDEPKLIEAFLADLFEMPERRRSTVEEPQPAAEVRESVVAA